LRPKLFARWRAARPAAGPYTGPWRHRRAGLAALVEVHNGRRRKTMCSFGCIRRRTLGNARTWHGTRTWLLMGWWRAQRERSADDLGRCGERDWYRRRFLRRAPPLPTRGSAMPQWWMQQSLYCVYTQTAHGGWLSRLDTGGLLPSSGRRWYMVFGRRSDLAGSGAAGPMRYEELAAQCGPGTTPMESFCWKAIGLFCWL
jgi:hypothetical protein